MASVDSQNYSPILEKRNFKDLLEEGIAAVEDDLITKIFSQTVQVSPSDEVATVAAAYDVLLDKVVENETEDSNGAVAHKSHQLNNGDQEVVDAEETEHDEPSPSPGESVIVADDSVVDLLDDESEPLEYDKVPSDFTHFNQTIVDLDDEDEDDDDDPCAIRDIEVDSQPEPMDSLSEEEAGNNDLLGQHIDTPSTASPVDDVEQSEIRDFEEFERITQVQTTPDDGGVAVRVVEVKEEEVIAFSDEEPIIILDQTTEGEVGEADGEESVATTTPDVVSGGEVVQEETPVVNDESLPEDEDDTVDCCSLEIRNVTNTTADIGLELRVAPPHAEKETTKTQEEVNDNDKDCSESECIVSSETSGTMQQQSEQRRTTKTVTTVTTSSTKSSSSSVQQQQQLAGESSEQVETAAEEAASTVQRKKSKKVKKARGSEKENISVVPRIDTEPISPRPPSPAAPPPPPPAVAEAGSTVMPCIQPAASSIGIFCSVRELSKLYEEKQLISRPRRPFIKEDIMQINLNVKNMCRSFLDLTQYSAAAMNEKAAPCSGGGATATRSHNGHSDKKLLFQRSKSITDLSRYQQHHRQCTTLDHHRQQHLQQQLQLGRELRTAGSAVSATTLLSRQLSSSVFFLQKLLFFENWRRCAAEAEAGREPCHQEHCPHCHSFSLRSAGGSQEIRGALPPQKIRISIMQFDMKSSFSKFDALQKKAAAAVASAQPHVNGSSANVPALLGQEQNAVRCTACDKVVYQMEQMKAENRFWHKNCFRCTTCNKPLAVDSYQSHESILYCKPHFKQLFSPKTVVESEDAEVANQKGPEMIIRESQPTALPEGVVRATDKVEDGLTLDDLHRLKNVKQAFEMFEKHQEEQKNVEVASAHKVEKSPSIINKLAQFQKKIAREASNRTGGRRKGVAADDLHGEPKDGNASESSSCYSSGDDEPPEGVDEDLWRSRRATNKIDPIQHCTDLDDLKKKFESNNAELERKERQEERREEIKRIRSRLFMGKQAKIKEQYQQAVLDSEYEHNQNGGVATATTVGIVKDKMQQLGDCDEPVVNTTKLKLLEMKSDNRNELEELRRQKQRDNLEIKSKFESGVEKSPSYRGADDPELMAQMVEKGIAKMSRNIFLEIDKQAAQQSGPKSPHAMPPSSLRKSNSMMHSPTSTAEVVNKSSENGGENGSNDQQPNGEAVIDTKDLQKKFAFFEKYQEQDRSPKKSTIHVTKFKDTAAVKEMFESNQVGNNNRSSRQHQDSIEDMVAVESNTTKKMLNLFRDIEANKHQQNQSNEPRPLKTFTPPPDGGRRLFNNSNNDNENGANHDNEEEDEEEEDSDPGVTDNSDIESEDEELLKKRIGKYDDEILEAAKKEARAQKLRAKFERWETEQIRMEQEQHQQDQGRREYLDPTQLESATNLREKFEFMSKGDLSQNNSPRKVMVNRFV